MLINKTVNSFSIRVQEKSVSPSVESQTVLPDENFDALK